jgi:MMP alpha-(1->4)-mannosyltransferase
MTQVLLRSRFGLESRRVPYCYDSNRFLARETAPHDPPTLLTVSRLQRYKNQTATILAAARLGPRVQVRLIGRGQEQDSLKRLAETHGVACRIDTDADDGEVCEAYLRARVAVCPSRFEGFGLTPVEAIASGTPTVASDIPPHREFVGSAARLFPLDDVDALAEAVAAALNDAPPDSGLMRDLTIPAAAERFLGLLRPLLR